MLASRFGHFLPLAAVIVATAPAMAETVTLQATHHNMYEAEVTLNGRYTRRALIDSGASSLSLCRTAAKTLRLKLGESVRLRTANGIITARRTVVHSVRIGAIEVRDVPTVVDDKDVPCDDEIIVGMSVLKHLHVTMHGKTMTLSSRGSVPPSPPSWSLLFGGMWVVLLMSLIGLRRRGGLRLRTGRPHMHIARRFL